MYLQWKTDCSLTMHAYMTSVYWPTSTKQLQNKAVIEGRLRPRCCYLGSYFKRPKSSPVRSLACNWYYCAQFTAKPKAACALRFSWAVTSSNLGLWANMTSSMKPEVQRITAQPEEDRAPAVDNIHKKIGEDQTCTSQDMIGDRQTHKHTHTHARTHVRLW